MRWSGSLLLLLVAVAVGALVVVDLRRPSEAGERPDPVAAGPAVGGAWQCAAGAVGETDDLAVVTATPPGVGAPSDTEIRALGDGSTDVAIQPVFPGSARLTELAVEGVRGDAVGAAVRWWDQPTAVSRVWEVTGEGPGGLVSGPCASGPSPTWYVPGLSTAEGGTARLYLANPFAADASVSISFTTPGGPETPILLENVSVPAASVEVVDLNEYIPRQADIGVVVRTRAGRVVVEGVQELDSAIGGVDAVALARAAPELAETWTVPWSLTDPTAPVTGDDPTAATPPAPADAETEAEAGGDGATEFSTRTASPGDGTASWIWVSNPGEEPAAVTVTLHTADGPLVPDIGDELLVEGGEILRVDLRGLLPPGQSAAGATVRVENGVPVVAGVSTLLSPESGDPARTGYTTQLGWPSADQAWVVPGEEAGEREQVLHLVNPGADPAVVDVAVWDGAGLRRPAGLQDVAVAPGALVELDITDVVAGSTHYAAFVNASEGSVVAGRHSVGDDVADWVAHTGVPASLWSGGDVVPPVDHDPQLIERLGTSGGLPVTPPGEVAPTPSPTPSPLTTEPAPTVPATEPSPGGDVEPAPDPTDVTTE